MGWQNLIVLAIGSGKHLRKLLTGLGVSRIYTLEDIYAASEESKMACDMVLVEWDAETTPAIIRQARTDGILRPQTPIIALGRCADQHQQEIACAVGVAAFVIGSITEQGFLSRVEAALNQANFVCSESYCGPDRRKDSPHISLGPRHWRQEDLAFQGGAPLGVRILRRGQSQRRMNRPTIFGGDHRLH